MGWSCSALASYRLDAITAFCVSQTGLQNVFYRDGSRMILEVSRREHADGAITGRIFRSDPNTAMVGAGTIRIEGDGRIVRGPRVLKDVPAFVLTVDRQQTMWPQAAACNDGLRLFIKAEYMKQYLPGGINYHISRSLGYLPYPTHAEVRDLHTGKVVATWDAAPFECW